MGALCGDAAGGEGDRVHADCHHTSRRDFLGKAALAGASLLPPHRAFAQTPATASAKPFRIDTHHHIYPTAYLQKQDRYTNDAKTVAVSGPVDQWTPSVSIDEMDKNGVATAITSLIVPDLCDPADVEGSRRLVRQCNEYSAKLMQDYPGRFGMFAVLTPLDVDGSLKEIAYCLDTLKADGVVLMSSVGGKYPGDPLFAPLFDELNRRKAVVFFHPMIPQCCGTVLAPVPAPVMEFPFDTTRTIGSLFLGGTFVRCPDIKFIFSHGGGTVAMLAGRWDALGRNTLAENLPGGVLPILRKQYYDVVDVANPIAFAALRQLAPMDRLLFGSDLPYLHIAETAGDLGRLGLDAAAMKAIQRDNALALFPRFKTS